MKHLVDFRVFESAGTGLTQMQEEFLNKYTKGSWSYNSSTGLVDVVGSFDCRYQGLRDFKGVRFGEVGGYFSCEGNQLTSLAGAPQKVRGSFYCQNNKLTTLEGAPQEVGGSFYCDTNQLTTLEGAPQEVGGNFSCSGNPLTTLKGAPQEVGGDFSCSGNPLTTLKGAPQEVGGSFYCGAFELGKGEWNHKGWLEILKNCKSEAQSLILTLLTPQNLNQEIQKDPAGMIIKLKEVWNDESFREIRSKLVWPRGYEEEADLVGDLDDIGF